LNEQEVEDKKLSIDSSVILNIRRGFIEKKVFVCVVLMLYLAKIIIIPYDFLIALRDYTA
jgi:hypothetical protein